LALRVHRSDVDGQTGMLRLKVQAEEKDPATGAVTRGPVEHIAIYPQALANILGTDRSPAAITAALRHWMAPRHAEMLQRKQMIDAVSRATSTLNNVTVEFD
jgi:hypothetical protein